MQNFWNKASWVGKIFGIGVVTIIAMALIFRVFWVTRVELHEMGYNFHWVKGELEVFTNAGWVVRNPIVNSVHTIDLRPMQIVISANQRVLNAKLVKFNPNGLQTFIEWHGRGAGGMNMPEILKCYAFDAANGTDCPFLEVVQEVSPNQGQLIKK